MAKKRKVKKSKKTKTTFNYQQMLNAMPKDMRKYMGRVVKHG